MNKYLCTHGQTTSVFFPENPMNSIKRQKARTLKDELPRSISAQNTTGDISGEITPERMKRLSQRKKITPSCGCDW